jgi:RimK family alpha-L-glutamate ligase
MKFAIVAHRLSDTNARLAGAAATLGFPAPVLGPREALRTLEPGDVALGRLDVLETLDGMEDGETELARLTDGGVEVLNSPMTLAVAHDKLLTARVLRQAGVPHPRTWHIADGHPSPAPELPLVIKPRFGSWGRDVIRCDTPADLDEAVRTLAPRPWFREQGVLAQELIEPRGWDMRVLVAGGRVVGCARRVAAEGEWRTNVALGASTQPAAAPPIARTLAVAAARAVKGDLVGVDLLPVGNSFVVVEVNGAVDFRPAYAIGDVYSLTILELLRVARDRLVTRSVPA